jgi:hypothetical protein
VCAGGRPRGRETSEHTSTAAPRRDMTCALACVFVVSYIRKRVEPHSKHTRQALNIIPLIDLCMKTTVNLPRDSKRAYTLLRACGSRASTMHA